MGLYRKVGPPVRVFTFEEFVQFGLKAPDVNIVNHEPWYFKFFGCQVSHENSEHYLLNVSGNYFDFKKSQYLVIDTSVKDGWEFIILSDKEFHDQYEKIHEKK